MVEDACESRDRVEFCCAWRLMLVKTLLVVELEELQGGFLEILYGGGDFATFLGNFSHFREILQTTL